MYIVQELNNLTITTVSFYEFVAAFVVGVNKSGIIQIILFVFLIHISMTLLMSN